MQTAILHYDRRLGGNPPLEIQKIEEHFQRNDPASILAQKSHLRPEDAFPDRHPVCFILGEFMVNQDSNILMRMRRLFCRR